MFQIRTEVSCFPVCPLEPDCKHRFPNTTCRESLDCGPTISPLVQVVRECSRALSNTFSKDVDLERRDTSCLVYQFRERCQCSVRNCRIPTVVARTQSVADSSSVHTLSACDVIDPMALMRIDPFTAVSTLKLTPSFASVFVQCRAT